MTPLVEPALLVHFGWYSLAPAFAAILMALFTKRVVESLLVGVAVGALILDSSVNGLLHSIIYFIPNTFITIVGHPTAAPLEGIGMIKDADRGALILLMFLIGSFITVIDKSGGVIHFAERVIKRIKSETGALLSAWLIGLSVFTSAFFSVMVTGTLMRPVFDRLKISREKLALYADCMSVPTKALLPISGWIGFMAVLIEDNIPMVGKGNGLAGFIQTIPYNFYCWLMPFFILLLALKVIPDFGPMRKAEKRVKETGLLHKEGAKPMIDSESEGLKKPKNGTTSDVFLPLSVSVIVMGVLSLWNLYFIKWFPVLPKLGIGSMQILIGAFALGIGVAMIKYVSKGLMSISEFLDITLEGGKAVIIGSLIILLAVTMGDLMKAKAPEGLGTATFLVDLLKPYLSAGWIPALTYFISCLVSFAAGTSWGTWAVMMPVSIPLALATGIDPFIVAGAVLSGGAWGDHCSPISDTCVLSSLSANTNHMEHVRTQMPYATLVGLVALVGYLLFGFFN